jgi:hypothetical protein
MYARRTSPQNMTTYKRANAGGDLDVDASCISVRTVWGEARQKDMSVTNYRALGSFLFFEQVCGAGASSCTPGGWVGIITLEVLAVRCEIGRNYSWP